MGRVLQKKFVPRTSADIPKYKDLLSDLRLITIMIYTDSTVRNYQSLLPSRKKKFSGTLAKREQIYLTLYNIRHVILLS